MLPHFEKLFEPYTKDGATLDKTLVWLAKVTKAPEQVIQTVVSETFLRLSEGVEFSTAGCQCGCGIKNAHTALEHYMRDEVLKLHAKAMAEYNSTVQTRLQSMVLAHIDYQNKKFVDENMKPGVVQRAKNWIGLR